MNAFPIDNSHLANTISVNLKTPGYPESTASKIASNLTSLEHELLALYSEPVKTTKEQQSKHDGKIEGLQLQYKRATRVYEGLQTLMKNMHEMIMRGIQNMRMN